MGCSRNYSKVSQSTMANDAPQAIQECVSLLQKAKNDTEKIAGLFIVSKLLLRSSEYDSSHKVLLFDAIGWTFLERLLVSTDVPEDCRPEVFKRLAISVLSAFCHIEEIITHPQLLKHIDVFLSIIKDLKIEDSENKILVEDTYQLLQSINEYEVGKKTLIENGALPELAIIYTQRRDKEALRLLILLITYEEKSVVKLDMKIFNNLLDVLALSFEIDHSDWKFEVARHLWLLLYNGHRAKLMNDVTNDYWPEHVRKGVTDILKSRVDETRLEPIFLLVAEMLVIFNIEWLLPTDDETHIQFVKLMINLTIVEIRMQLEDRSIEDKYQKATLIVACFCILEFCFSSPKLKLNDNVIADALNAVTTALMELFESRSNEMRRKYLIHSVVRVLAALLALETPIRLEPVYLLLSNILEVANKSFHDQRLNFANETNLLRLLLPALCYLSGDDEGRKIMLEENEDEVLFEYFRITLDTICNERGENEIKVHCCATVELLCQTFMNFIVMGPQLIEERSIFYELTVTIIQNLREIAPTRENLILRGNLIVLGLLLLEHQWELAERNDANSRDFVEHSIMFLKQAHCEHESNLVVSEDYKELWDDLWELWFLGMQTLGSLFARRWILDLVLENGLIRDMVDILQRVNIASVPGKERNVFEDFLCSLVKSNKDTAKTLIDYGVLIVCQRFHLVNLQKRLSRN